MKVGTDRTFGSDSVRYGDPVYFGRFGFGSDSLGFYRTYAESTARARLAKNISNFDATIYKFLIKLIFVILLAYTRASEKRNTRRPGRARLKTYQETFLKEKKKYNF